MKFPIAGALVLALLASTAAFAATPQDQAFVAKVGQGGMFEVEAGRLAETKAAAVDVRDFATAEVHDHVGVGDRLKATASKAGIAVPASLNGEWQGKLDHLKTLSGPAFDAAYMQEMASLHAADGAAFKKESQTGGSADFRDFGRETHLIVARHIGAIHAAAPPAR